MNEIIISLQYCDQWKDTKDEKWAGKTCAICCLKMILIFKDHKSSDLEIMDLVREGLDINGHSNVGWSHKAIVELAGKHGVKMDYRKVFYYSDDEKQEGLKFIISNLSDGKPVIASVWNKDKTGGHLVVVNGFKENGELYSIVGPDSRNESHYFLSKNEFIHVWRGGLIWLLGN